jgi:hypothetical protein
VVTECDERPEFLSRDAKLKAFVDTHFAPPSTVAVSHVR